MNKNMKLRYRAALSLFLSMILLTIPAVAFSMNGNNAIEARAEEETESGTGKILRNRKQKTVQRKIPKFQKHRTAPGNASGTGNGRTDRKRYRRGNRGSTESRTVSGNDIEPVCICEDKCGAYEYDHNCKVCVEDYKLCAYKKPNVSISINKPDGWFNDTVSVTFKVADVAHTEISRLRRFRQKSGRTGAGQM